MLAPERRFYHILAEKLGRTVGELLASISSSEIIDWAAHFELMEQERAVKEKRHNKDPNVDPNLPVMGRRR